MEHPDLTAQIPWLIYALPETMIGGRFHKRVGEIRESADGRALVLAWDGPWSLVLRTDGQVHLVTSGTSRALIASTVANLLLFNRALTWVEESATPEERALGREDARACIMFHEPELLRGEDSFWSHRVADA